MGRPTDDPKNLSTRIRLSDKDIEMIDFCCDFYSITKAEAIRRGVKELYEKAKK
ncbi:MAG: hypothetical protein FWD48_01220 [Oscillospiraceae bacterium]|nr:hypothetical protein [Oscillospiraceae bacterium]